MDLRSTLGGSHGDENAVHLVRRFLSRLIEKMRVDLKSERDGGVPEQLLDRLGMHTLGDQQGRGAVSRVVRANPAQPGGVEECPDALSS